MVSYFPSRILCAVLLMMSFTAWASSSQSQNIDNELGRVIDNSYHYFSKSATDPDDLNNTLLKANNYFQTANYADSLRALAAGNALSTKHFHDPNMQATIRLALQLHAQITIEKLLIQAQQQANIAAEAVLIFELSKFYANLENWEKVGNLLADDSLFEQLSSTDRAEAYVLLGTALQKQKKHREAMQLYEKVTEDSNHFRIAQLNLATSYLRQDWWTDAFSAINNALKINAKKRDALDYRLYTVLGYAQIQFGFYRDARESFRNIAISSEYAHRALLGLGIAALHQQDFIGALNAFDKLRVQSQQDISIAEAHLLSAFTLRQLEQYDAATIRYQEAINYYQNASADITTQLNSANQQWVKFFRAEHKKDKLIINNTRKIVLLDGLVKTGASSDSSSIGNLINKINRESNQRATYLLQEEKAAIDSYLSQSRFGLASLYDHK